MNAIYPRYDSEFACASRVLVVDSEEAHTRLMRLALEREGFDVEIVGSVDEAMSKPLGDYGLFIVDMKMNNMQGCRFRTHAPPESIHSQYPAYNMFDNGKRPRYCRRS